MFGAESPGHGRGYHRGVRTRILYSDLDGTLLGPGGSLFSTTEGGWSLRATEALLAMHESGLKLALVSGRTQAQMSELARALSAGAYLAEMGAIIVDRSGGPEEVHRDFGSYKGDLTPFEEMARSGAGALILDEFGGAIEPHAPWSFQPREATMLFRGHVNTAAANELLRQAGHAWLRLEDNGIIRRAFPGLNVDEVHAYHLVPAGVSKAAGVLRHMEIEGIARGEAAAIGDSLSDLAMAAEVGRMFLVGNHAAGEELPDNARRTRGSHGEGFAEAVSELLSQG
jgi:HAD superfamily hydrolase (TIGR01484 family)